MFGLGTQELFIILLYFLPSIVVAIRKNWKLLVKIVLTQLYSAAFIFIIFFIIIKNNPNLINH